MPSQISDPCLQETSCSKYHFSSLCKGRSVGTCCQGSDCSNGLCNRVLWDCSLWWWGHRPTLLSPPAPCSPSLVEWPWSCCSLMPLSKGDHRETIFMGWMEICVEKMVLYRLLKFYPEIYLYLQCQFEVILCIQTIIIPCSIWSP